MESGSEARLSSVSRGFLYIQLGYIIVAWRCLYIHSRRRDTEYMAVTLSGLAGGDEQYHGIDISQARASRSQGSACIVDWPF